MANDIARARKTIATEFLQLVIAGRIEEAYQKHVDMSGKHHNPYFAAGFPALMQAMIENHSQFPSKSLTVKNVLVDDELVAVHSHLVISQDQPEMAAVHVFCFHDHKIVEMWDCGMPIPADSPNKDGAF